MSYDSTTDTLNHINRIRDLLGQIIGELERRAEVHDRSKLQPPEKEAFDELIPKLKELTFGSEEYRATVQQMKPAIDRHYANNSHHPEHYGMAGINGMGLLDLIEMLADWKAAGERHPNGNMEKSLRINKERFKIDDQLFAIVWNTAERIGWLSE